MRLTSGLDIARSLFVTLSEIPSTEDQSFPGFESKSTTARIEGQRSDPEIYVTKVLALRVETFCRRR